MLLPVPKQLSAMRGVLSVLGLEQASQAVLRMRDDVDALLSTEVDPAHAAQTGTFDRLAGNLGALGFLIDMFSVQPQLAKSLFAFDAESGTLNPLMGRPRPHMSEAEPAAPPETLVRALGRTPEFVAKTKTNWLCVYPRADDVRALRPDHALLAAKTAGRNRVVVAAFPVATIGVER